MPSIGPTELVIVLVVALLILGPKRLPAPAAPMTDDPRARARVLAAADAAHPDRFVRRPTLTGSATSGILPEMHGETFPK